MKHNYIIMAERADFSPSGQDFFQGNRCERFMLRRIAGTALRFPEEFDRKGRAGSMRVHGTNVDGKLTLGLEEILPDDLEDDSVRFTEVNLLTNLASPRRVLDLGMKQYETDEIADRMGTTPRGLTFELGAEDNGLSMYRVMRTITLGAQVIEWSGTLEHLLTAEPHGPSGSFPQTF